ncbi:hypothetical protein [Shouchella lonarensis]|uniref:Uncharacterized protein n=1 Tax=Shouchella lonarensis TaxID=1464122 RepID=A0A1G6HZB4_9BACI|nr:hypothetical protein [Shouchella lonarensis]SDB99612.1 hypothetical protein SAMN05421737_104247 [Shouchella lonarensis]
MFWSKWWKTITVIVGIIALTVGGIVLANNMSNTGDIALDDTFTSKFIDRSVKADDGFHFFESQNGHYTMWFPSGYYLKEEGPMYVSKDHYERLSMRQDKDGDHKLGGNEFVGEVRTMYRGAVTQGGIDTNLRMLLDDVSYNGDHKEIGTEDTVIYYGSSNFGLKDKRAFITDPKESYANKYFALIQDKEGDQFLTVKYSLFCPNEDESACGNNGEEEAHFFDTFIRNIKFR